MKNFTVLLIALALLSGSCSKENDLKSSVFMADPENPELPAYSEWGYNTFGAYYDRVVFRYNDYTVPAKVEVTEGNTRLTFAGQYSQDFYYDPQNAMSMTFEFPDFNPSNFSDLTTWNEKNFDLKTGIVNVLIHKDTVQPQVQILSGILQFNRVQLLKVDDKLEQAILSGYFNFKALIDGVPVTVSEGRFDVGISQDNFYAY